MGPCIIDCRHGKAISDDICQPEGHYDAVRQACTLNPGDDGKGCHSSVDPAIDDIFEMPCGLISRKATRDLF